MLEDASDSGALGRVATAAPAAKSWQKLLARLFSAEFASGYRKPTNYVRNLIIREPAAGSGSGSGIAAEAMLMMISEPPPAEERAADVP